LLAIILACKYFGWYLIGKNFTIVTDHRPLTWILSVKDPSSGLLRWRLLLEEYDYTTVYEAGKINVNSCALSRNAVVMTVMITTNEIQQKILKKKIRMPGGWTPRYPTQV
jgi:hypothetical protein